MQIWCEIAFGGNNEGRKLRRAIVQGSESLTDETAQDAYSKGAKVSHTQKHWVSNVDGNVLSRGRLGLKRYGARRNPKRQNTPDTAFIA